MNESLNQKEAEDRKRISANSSEDLVYDIECIKRNGIRIKTGSYNWKHNACCSVVDQHSEACN
jgi:hypothetical protein